MPKTIHIFNTKPMDQNGSHIIGRLSVILKMRLRGVQGIAVFAKGGKVLENFFRM